MSDGSGAGAGAPAGGIASADAAATAAAKARAAALIGRVIAERYRVDELLALGGMGAVFRGEHVHMRKRVAIKVLHPATLGFAELVTRFERESVVGAHVSHRNVCAATDFGRLDDGSCYLVLEFVDGVTLHKIMREGPMPPARAGDLARQLAAGLSAAHELGICHRDVKPGNIMVVTGKRDLLKIIDFGLAKVPVERFSGNISDAISVTTAGTVFGTVAYMAPELARGMQAVTHLSDLYALGVILYEMLTGRHPFDPIEPSALFRDHRFTPPPPFHLRAPEVAIDPALEAITFRLLEKKPEARYASAAEVIDALDGALGGPASAGPHSGAPRSSARTEPVSSPSQRRPSAEPASGPRSAPSGRGTPHSLPPARGGSLMGTLSAIGGLLVLAAVLLWVFPEWRERLLPGVFGPAAGPTVSAAPSIDPRRAAASATASAAPDASGRSAISTGSASAGTTTAVAPVPGATKDGLDAVKWRAILRDAADKKDATRGAGALLALAELDATAFGAAEVIVAAGTVAVGIESGDRATADRVFEVLGGATLGSGGPDVLYDAIVHHGGSRGAKRASDLLARPDVAARATPALRIALDLRNTPCSARNPLFERAGREGDDRAQVILSAMRSVECDKSSGACCMLENPGLENALIQINARMKK